MCSKLKKVDSQKQDELLLNADDPESIVRQLDQKIHKEIDDRWGKLKKFKLSKGLDLKFEDIIRNIEKQKKENLQLSK